MAKTNQHHKSTWFLLGREPLLSAAELFSLLDVKPDEKYEYNAPFLFLQREVDLNLINKLGGTIKIAKQIVEDSNEHSLIESLKKVLREHEGKITFGISLYGKNVSQKTIESWGKQIKKDLKSEGRSVRYVFKNEITLSSVTVEKNGLTNNGFEFMVLQKGEDRFACARTIAVQPFESFGARDFGRPGRDSESGMLPPKLALMMLNLGKINPNTVLLDPFCGSGTLITEALLQGVKNIFGTDLSEKAIADTKTNLQWHKQNSPGSDQSKIDVKVFDVKKLGEGFSPNSIDLIVTEPYLGKPLRGIEKRDEIEKQAKELLELYVSAFSEFKKVLRTGGAAIFIVPQFITRELPIIISDRLIKEIKKFGFEPEPLLPNKIFSSPFILYRRPDQRVAREIWKFRLSSTR
jgi:tRNA G10  N-methylase Trm11